jgi:DNA-binding transcriptional LysR family regulator
MARLDNVDLRLLRVFLVVVEAGGLSAAQTRLNVSVSTISNQISALETRLGVRLCQRGRTGFRLTPDGETVYGEMQKLFAAVDDFDLRVANLRSRLKGHISLGMVDSTLTDRSAPLHRAIDSVVGRMPGIHISLDCRPPNELLRDVMERKLDVAVGSFPKILLGLHYVQLYEERHYLYCGRGHGLFEQEAPTVEMVDRQSIVWRSYWAQRDVRHRHPPSSSTATVSTMEAAARLILSGRYIGYLPGHYAESWVGTGEMRCLLPEELTYTAPFEAVFGDHVEQRRPLRLFVEALFDMFGLDPVDIPLSGRT